MEEKNGLQEFNEALDTLRESSQKNKDYYKFIIGLATGTLIFSVTFLKEFVQFPEYKFILIIGWFCMLVSIITGVLVLPKGDILQVKLNNLKNLLKSPEKLIALSKRELQEHYIKSYIKTSVESVIKDDEKAKDFYKLLNKLSAETLKKLYEGLQLTGVDNPKDIRFLKEFLREIFRFLSLLKIEERESYPPALFRSLRIIILELIYLEKVMKYAFFFGIFAISLFSIINFLR